MLIISADMAKWILALPRISNDTIHFLTTDIRTVRDFVERSADDAEAVLKDLGGEEFNYYSRKRDTSDVICDMKLSEWKDYYDGIILPAHGNNASTFDLDVTRRKAVGAEARARRINALTDALEVALSRRFMVRRPPPVGTEGRE